MQSRQFKQSLSVHHHSHQQYRMQLHTRCFWQSCFSRWRTTLLACVLKLGRGGTFEQHIQGLKVHDRNRWKLFSATLSSWLPIVCNMFAQPCQKRAERQACRKSHQVMIRSFATSAQTIVVLSIGSMKRRAAFDHMT